MEVKNVKRVFDLPLLCIVVVSLQESPTFIKHNSALERTNVNENKAYLFHVTTLPLTIDYSLGPGLANSAIAFFLQIIFVTSSTGYKISVRTRGPETTQKTRVTAPPSNDKRLLFTPTPLESSTYRYAWWIFKFLTRHCRTPFRVDMRAQPFNSTALNRGRQSRSPYSLFFSTVFFQYRWFLYQIWFCLFFLEVNRNARDLSAWYTTPATSAINVAARTFRFRTLGGARALESNQHHLVFVLFSQFEVSVGKISLACFCKHYYFFFQSAIKIGYFPKLYRFQFSQWFSVDVSN